MHIPYKAIAFISNTKKRTNIYMSDPPLAGAASLSIQ